VILSDFDDGIRIPAYDFPSFAVWNKTEKQRKRRAGLKHHRINEIKLRSGATSLFDVQR
jgi:hypothetical protein